MFSPERDQASKSRHKLVDSPPTGPSNHAGTSSGGGSGLTGDPVANGFNFFGSVGASLLPETGRGKASTSNQHHIAGGSHGGAGAGSLHDLFSWGMFDPSAAHHALFTNRPDVNVDPFLNHAASGSGSNDVNAGNEKEVASPYTIATGSLPPLTIKDPQDLKAKQAALISQNPRAIDPVNMSIGGGGAPPPAKRARLPSLTTNGPSMIPVTYSHPQTPILHTALSSDAGGLDNDDMETSPLHAVVHGHSHSLSLDGQLGLDTTGAGMNASEDKRRRNTLASARFRAKKKEREAAMERKARELDEKVAELERECEVLRKENNWLKGLVVGASSTTSTPPNGPTATTTTVMEEPVATTSNVQAGPSSKATSGVVEAAKGSVIDVDELLRVLKASGAVLTGSSVSGEASTQKQGPAPATGKRKRSAGNN
jgi:hypothetical protein